jgi:hypothetical protein
LKNKSRTNASGRSYLKQLFKKRTEMMGLLLTREGIEGEKGRWYGSKKKVLNKVR